MEEIEAWQGASGRWHATCYTCHICFCRLADKDARTEADAQAWIESHECDLDHA